MLIQLELDKDIVNKIRSFSSRFFTKLLANNVAPVPNKKPVVSCLIPGNPYNF